MSLPDVNVTLDNGTLGAASDSPDGVTVLVMTGVTATGLALGMPKVVYSLSEAEALGITADSDNASAYRHISEFYAGYRFITDSDVAELYIMLVANTMTLTQMATVTETSGAIKAVDFAQGRARYLGLCRTPAGSYTPVLTDGVDADSLTALAKADELGDHFKGKQWPIRTLIEARSFAYANVGSVKDLSTYAYPRAGLVLWSTQNDGSASVGYTLGVKAGLPVQRKISRVKNGAMAFDNAYIGDTPVKNVAALGTLHDKGYICLRQFPNRSGYFFTGEAMATKKTDDYYILSRGAVIDKAQRIAYDTFLDEVEDDIEVDADGQTPAGYKLFIEQKVIGAIKRNMVGAISGEPLFNIPDGQNILSNSTTNAVLAVKPVAYQSNINVKLGFYNPA